MSTTGENEQALRKILDLTRLVSVAVLLLHFYHTCYLLFQQWGYTHPITDRLLTGVAHTGLLHPGWFTKAISISLLYISLIGTKGKKQEGLHTGRLLAGMMVGCLLVLSYGNCLSRVICLSIKSDIFNTWNESFPQE